MECGGKPSATPLWVTRAGLEIARQSGVALRLPCSLHGSLVLACEKESQRDSGPKPRVARNELPWVCNGGADSTLKGLWPFLFRRRTSRSAPQPFQGCLAPINYFPGWLVPRNPALEDTIPSGLKMRDPAFGIVFSDFFRASSFVIRHSHRGGRL